MDTGSNSYLSCSYNCECHFAPHSDLMECSTCMKCRYRGSQWFCLSSGHMECGIHNSNTHTLDHQMEIKHEGLENFCLWDYAKENCPNSNDLEPQANANAIDVVSHKAKCLVRRHHQIPTTSPANTCMSCSGTKNLWLCLNCRYIGCGRAQNAHALHHYQRTEHRRVMQLKTFRIWDYKEEKYVHRLCSSDSAKDLPADVSVSKSARDEDFERRMKRLEEEWSSFSTLKETNLQMISIEQRLIALSEEKKMFEDKLREHDAKLNELLNQFRGNRQRDVLPISTDRNHNISNQNDNDSGDILNEPNAATSFTSKPKPILTITVTENFEPTQWIHLSLVLLLVLYNCIYLLILGFSANI